MQPVEVPIVECLLAAPACYNGIPGLGLLNEGLGLAAFHALGEKCLTKGRHFKFSIGDSENQGDGTPLGRSDLLKAGQPIRQLSALRTGQDQLPPAPSPIRSSRQRVFQLSELGQRRLEG
jgi:hypothetical protein